MVADGVSVRQQRRGEAPEARFSPPPPPWDAMGTLAVKERSSQAGLLVVVGLQEGARMEPGSHAPHKNGSSPPGRQVGGDAAAMGLAQALVSSGLERG